MNRNKILLTSIVLSAMLGTAPHNAAQASAAETAPAQTQAAYSYQKYQQEALAYLNDIRVKAGLSPLEMNPYLTKAAENHAKYLSSNEETGHEEVKGYKGFTGVSSSDRVQFTGGGSDLSRYSAETIAYGVDTLSGINNLLSGVYHRNILLSRYTNTVGVSNIQGVLTIVSSTDMGKYEEDKDVVVYPISGQKNVPVGFYGHERPNPLEKYKVTKSGYALTVDAPSAINSEVNLTLKDSKGNAVPVFLEISDDRENINIFPKYELAFEEMYTATTSFKTESGSYNKTWSFTTTDKPTNLSIYDTNEYRLSLNGKFTSSNLQIEHEGYYHQNAPLIYKNVAYLPAQYLLERLNLDVTFDTKTKKYNFNAKDHKIMWQEGSQYASVNKKNVKLTQKPLTFHGDLYLPASFVTATTGAKVKYMPNRRTVYVDAKVYTPENLITRADK